MSAGQRWAGIAAGGELGGVELGEQAVGGQALRLDQLKELADAGEGAPVSPGQNYLNICRAAVQHGDTSAQEAVDGIG